MRHFTFRLAMGYFIAFAIVSQSRSEELVKIGSWNIEHLGQRSPAQSPKALAQLLFLGSPDVIALQEIYDTDSTNELRNTQLDAAFAELNQIPGNDWKYVLTRKNDPEDVDSKRQNVGVAWNQNRVKLLAGPDKIDVEVPSSELPAGLDQGSYPWRRPPYAWHFAVEGKTDFVLIPLHWKSNSDGEDLGKTIRALEGKSLAEEIDSVKEKYSDEDIVVLGDTNCKSADEAAISALTGVGFKDLNADDLVTYMSGTSPFDRFIVLSDDDENPEFRYSRQYALMAADREAHDRALSDHFMILMAFRPMDDDD